MCIWVGFEVFTNHRIDMLMCVWSILKIWNFYHNVFKFKISMANIYDRPRIKNTFLSFRTNLIQNAEKNIQFTHTSSLKFNLYFKYLNCCCKYMILNISL